MTRPLFPLVVLILVACSARTDESKEIPLAEQSGAIVFEDCVQIFAVSVHSTCEQEHDGTCEATADTTRFELAHEPTLRACLTARPDMSPCSSAATVSCPPAVSDAECARAKVAALAVCEMI